MPIKKITIDENPATNNNKPAASSAKITFGIVVAILVLFVGNVFY
jgi:hypothetical protein